MMKKLLQIDKDGRWNLDGIEFAIEERVGNPENFIGRVAELEYLYSWADNIKQLISRSVAFLGRRKIGKSLMLERLYNIIYSEHKGIIPFYYEFTEGIRSGKNFFEDFTCRFYLQVIGYYTGDITWNRRGVDQKIRVDFSTLQAQVEPLNIPHKVKILSDLDECMYMMKRDDAPYEYIIAATAAPRSFATTPGVKERIVQMIDEFQYLNMYIDAGVEDKPCKAYMSTAEMKVAPLLITGSLMGVVSEELMRWLPQRFFEFIVPKMNDRESIAMISNYGKLYGHGITPEIAEYIAYTTNHVPGRIVELLTPKFGKTLISTVEEADQALEYEVDRGAIKHDWDEYLSLAMDAVNDVNMRKITFFLCQHEGQWFYPRDIKQALSIELDDQTLRKELALLYKYDIVEKTGGRYGGVFDRTLKKVLMKQYGDIFNLPVEEFDAYFRNDSMLDYLQERMKHLELGLAEAEELRQTLSVLRGEHNNLKGHDYERQVLLSLIKAIIDGEGGLTDGIKVTDFSYILNYNLTSGEEIDIVLEGGQSVIMAECKNYAPEYLHKITEKMVGKFADKAHRLHKDRFSGKKLRLVFFSKHGFEEKLKPTFERHDMAFR
ncbi:hypothetical protein QUF76_06715 [Desulfobacterales bacterium HSG16]|nr:hypothetical protein [Desulfobacterales bacterium HSG16]